MAWRLAESLKTLRQQVNLAFPERSKVSDGSIGNEEHASRSSDHNPWVHDGKIGVVTAIDLTHDPKHRFDSYQFAEALRKSKDSRIKYIISNRRICSPDQKAWAWRPYKGKNPHDHHCHVSVKSDKASYDSTKSWDFNSMHGKPIDVASAAHELPRTIRRGDQGADVEKLQKLLNISTTGVFTEQVASAVKAFQNSKDLVADGVVGAQTWKALGA